MQYRVCSPCVPFFFDAKISGLLCGSQLQMWNIRELQEHVKLDHGYTYDSKVVHCFFQILTNFNRDEQEKFLQFVTGSPRLPIGGLLSIIIHCGWSLVANVLYEFDFH